MSMKESPCQSAKIEGWLSWFKQFQFQNLAWKWSRLHLGCKNSSCRLLQHTLPKIDYLKTYGDFSHYKNRWELPHQSGRYHFFHKKDRNSSFFSWRHQQYLMIKVRNKCVFDQSCLKVSCTFLNSCSYWTDN